MSFAEKIRQAMVDRGQNNLLRSRKTLSGSDGILLSIDNQQVIQFCSNDYLGLSHHPAVVEAFCQGAVQMGAGSGGSHLISGHAQAHHELELALAKAVKREKALYFSTGYMANLAVMGALLGRQDTVIEDKLNHASLIDAARLSGAKVARYRHGDMNQLDARLQKADGNKLVVTDGVFSMDGDVAPLQDICALAATHDAWVMVDDAHGFGVLGEGAGAVCEAGFGSREVPILMCTLGKAMGTFGAFVAADAEVIDYLIQFARPYIYTTALPAAMAAATQTALSVSQTERWRRERVLQLTAAFKQFAQAQGIALMPSDTPIQPILVKDAHKAVAISEALYERGIWVSAIRPPTVPQGESRLRVTFSAAHSDAQFEQLTETLADIWQKTGAGYE